MIFQSIKYAGVDIRKASVSTADEHSITLIEEDTDLLILLLYSVKDNSNPLYFTSDIQ